MKAIIKNRIFVVISVLFVLFLGAGCQVGFEGGYTYNGKSSQGMSCTDGSECLGGVCLTDDYASYCSETCYTDWDCSAGYSCGQTTEGYNVCIKDW